jgi:hypothetical protein
MGVAHRHLNFLVTHELGNGTKIHAGHDHATGKRVPQIVPSELLDTGICQRILEPVTGAEQSTTAALTREDWIFASPPTKQFLKGCQGFSVQRNVPTVSVLAGGHEQITAQEIDAGPVDSVVLFARTHARGQRDFELAQVTGELH